MLPVPPLSDHGPSTFEQAIEKTGFGKFNYMLITMIMTGSMSSMFETTSMSYIFAPAQCDLDLSLQDKGYLNSITYAGMVSGSFVWGLLLDRFGRKKLMVYGFLLNAVFVFMSGFSQSIEMLIICKFFGGLIINGPFTAMIAYLGELHSSAYRSKVLLVNGAFMSAAQIMCPILAWIILPLSIEWPLFNGYIELHSWNLYLFTIGLLPLSSAIFFIFLPESPKFLMTYGENEKALIILRKIYSINTGNPAETYPVKELIVEKEKTDIKKSITQECSEECQHLGPLFKQPYLFKLILITAIQMLFVQGLNMLRLWTPQLFQALADYKLYNNGTTTDLCTMLEVLQPNSNNDICVTNINSQVYINTIIVSFSALVGFFICVIFINIIGKKGMIIALSWAAAVSGCCLFFAQGTTITTILISVFISCGNICGNIVLNVGVDVFPTNWRALVISLIMAIARTGAMVGNLIFPILLSLGCAPPFFVVGSFLAVGGLLAIFLPDTEKKALI